MTTSSSALRHDPGAQPASIPGVDAILLMAILVAGGAAAFVAGPLVWIATPLCAITVFIANRRSMLSQIPRDEVAPIFPPRLQDAISSAMMELPYGDAQRLLSDVVRQARPLFAARESAFDEAHENETREHVTELVEGACEIALEFGQLEIASAGGVAQRSVAGSAAPCGSADELARRYGAARQALMDRLTDAASALGALYASGIEQGTPASDRVAELASEIRSDAAARTHAKTEMDGLLDPGGRETKAV